MLESYRRLRTMISEVYEAFKEANVSDATARKAAEAAAAYEACQATSGSQPQATSDAHPLELLVRQISSSARKA